MSVHIFHVRPHIKIGCTPVRHTWELFKNVLLEFFSASHQICLGNGFPRACPSVFFFLTHFDRFCSKKIRAYRQSFSAWRWASEVMRPLHWDIKFDFECPRAVRCTRTRWHWKTCSQSLSASSRIMFSFLKKIYVTGLPVLVMNSQLLFADSLTSTLIDWLGNATGLSVLARLHSHIQ